MVKKIIKGLIPKPMRPWFRKEYIIFNRFTKTVIRRSYRFLPDKIEIMTGKRDPLTPPQWRVFVGHGDYKEIGREFFGYFVDLAGLKQEEKVLDVGCGIGRMAVPLTGYLKDGGAYEGIDIVPDGIKWCKKNISTRFPNFHFILTDIFNNTYNPAGTYKAENYRFPFREEYFDFVFLTSVFTHMLPREMEHYLDEIRRVLKKGGRVLITYFLLNEESLKCIELNKSSLSFQYALTGCRVNNMNVYEDAVAYDQAYIRELFEMNHFKILEPVRYGSWCGRDRFLSYQDLVIAVKNH